MNTRRLVLPVLNGKITVILEEHGLRLAQQRTDQTASGISPGRRPDRQRVLRERMMNIDPRHERLRSLAQLRDGAYQRRRELMNEVRQVDEDLARIISEMVKIQVS